MLWSRSGAPDAFSVTRAVDMSTAGGIIVVHKPAGMTSFAVVSKVRRLFHVRRAGHCGTLDPFAEGVLPVCVEKATAVVRYMENYDKKYKVVMRFGAQTDTQDVTGTVIGGRNPDEEERRAIAASGFCDLREAVARYSGEMEQLPPMYSAIKINGTPLYKYARQGIDVERARRKIRIHSAVLTDATVDPEFTASMDIHCSKGTYIRTICEELGQQLGYGAHATALCRTSCGPYTLEESVTLEELERIVASADDPWKLFGETRGFHRTDSAIATMARLELTDADALKLVQGQIIVSPAPLKAGERCAAYRRSGQWIGVVKTVDPDGTDAPAGTDFCRKAEGCDASGGAYDEPESDGPCEETEKGTRGDMPRLIKAERIFIDANDFRG